MEKWKNYWKQFMDGRNGSDECAKACVVGFVCIYLLGVILQSGLLQILALFMLVYSLFRIFSQNREERMRENQRFLRYVQMVQMNFAQRKTHRIFMCKRCGKLVRVPRGKGKIEITCPVCGNKMVHRT